MTTNNNNTPTTPTYYTAAEAFDVMYEMPVGAVVAIDETMWEKTGHNMWQCPGYETSAEWISDQVTEDDPLLRIDGLPEVRAAIEADAEMKALTEDTENN